MSPRINLDDPVLPLIRQAWVQMYVDVEAAARSSQQALDATANHPGHPCRGEAWFHLGFAFLRASQREQGASAIDNARAAFELNNDERGLLLCDEIDAFRLRLSGKVEAALAMQLRIRQRCTRTRTVWRLATCVPASWLPRACG